MCCLDIVQSHDVFYGCKFNVVLFLWGGFELKKDNTDQGDCTYLVKITVSCAVVFLCNNHVLYPHTTGLTQFMKVFPVDALFGITFYGCMCEMDNLKKKKKKTKPSNFCLPMPSPHPVVPLYCKYFRYLQLFRAVEWDAGLELYSWSSRTQLWENWKCRQLWSCY